MRDPVIAALREQQRLYDAFVASIDTDSNEAACAAYNASFEALIKTKPSTRKGAVALISRCLVDDARFPADGDAVTLLHTLARALPGLAR